MRNSWKDQQSETVSTSSHKRIRSSFSRFHHETQIPKSDFSLMVWPSCSCDASLLWCTSDCPACRFSSGSSPLSKAAPSILIRGTFFSTNGSWHTVSFYPHLAFPLFTRRHCTLSSPLFCVIKLVRGFSSFKCSCYYFKAVQETIKWNNNSCNSIPSFVLNLLFSLSKGRWEGQAQWHMDDKEIMQMLGVRDVHRFFLSWGKCQKEWFEYSLTWNVWRKCLWENFEWHISNVWPGPQTGYYICWEAISPYEVMGVIQWLIVSRILYRSNYTEMEKKNRKE